MNLQEKKYIRSKFVGIFLLMILLISYCTLTGAGGYGDTIANPELTEQTRSITVIGEGIVQVVPDIAFANIGIETINTNVLKATGENSATMKIFLEKLHEMGIDEKDIQTYNYSIYFEQAYDRMYPQKLDEKDKSTCRYHVNNMVKVVIRNLDNVASILDVAVTAGANSIHGIRFTVENESELDDKVRNLAMSDASGKAKKLAELANVELGDVLSISEVVDSQMGMNYGIGGGGGFPPGEKDYKMQIKVTFLIK